MDRNSNDFPRRYKCHAACRDRERDYLTVRDESSWFARSYRTYNAGEGASCDKPPQLATFEAEGQFYIGSGCYAG